MQRLSASEQVVLTTLAYCDQFDFPLTLKEIAQRTPFRKWRALADLKKTLDALRDKKLVEKSGDLFCLAERRGVFQKRHQRQKIADQKWRDVIHFIKQIHRIPWIKAVFITGAFALKNSDEDDDIDFLIIVSPTTLWLSRLCVTFFAFLSGRRRSWQGEEKRSWCLNLWLDQQHLQIDPAQQNLYTAYEVIQAYPIFDRSHTVDLFYQSNLWVQKFLPNWWNESDPQKLSKADSKVSSVVRMADWLAWKLQLIYMNSHRTSEKIGRGFAFFHPRDTRGIIFKNWQDRLTELGLQLPTDTIGASENSH